MQDLIFSVNAVLPLFLLMAVGWGLTQLKVWDEGFLKTANGVTFNLLIPTMLFFNISQSNFGELFDIKFLIFSILAIAIVVGLGLIIVPKTTNSRARQGAIVQALFRGNFALLGIPLAQELAGDIGAKTASVFLAFLIPVFNVLATVLLSIYSDDEVESPGKIIIRILKNPLIIGCAFGMLFSLCKIPIPKIIFKPVQDLRNIATPLALLVLGGDFKFESFVNNLKCVIATGLTRLLVIPGIALFAAVMLGFRGVLISLVITIFATPVAVSSTAMTYKMHGDYELACQLVVFTTVFSALSITLLTFIIRTLGLI